MLQPCIIGRVGVPAVPGDAFEKRSDFGEVYLAGYMPHFIILGFLGRYCFFWASDIAFWVTPCFIIYTGSVELTIFIVIVTTARECRDPTGTHISCCKQK